MHVATAIQALNPALWNRQIAGAPLLWWIGFHIAVLALVTADALLPHSRTDKPRPKLAWLWSLFVACAAGGFAFWLNFEKGHQAALEFASGYTIETSLSIDNLFVFLILFRGFRISHREQHRALLWGVFGAILLRAVFIVLGVSLLDRFEWVSYIFGTILLYAAWRLLRGQSASDALPGWVIQLQKHQRSLLFVILAVEATDLLFAVDSIPAVLAVSRDPFVVYTSNIAAILGLRSLYFALSSLLDHFHYLHYGLGALLAFVAAKMFLAHWIEIPTVWSLAIMAVILGICALFSILHAPRHITKRG
ncbi:branched-chain amino acid ABC transporter substrate-binding protein [Acidicapsa dinghuensis]|uniref:Branched-chain amino acid ABC transporter substrate-binding protein n=1 Tax=Acidicapsa dinghuensis TaxID=2218256 RepID=A0ABW1EMD6_9BACT|nr:branched-chain amino acid ABC transporter substrate-binding protein [Acidicapsa dinghuensis]